MIARVTQAVSFLTGLVLGVLATAAWFLLQGTIISALPATPPVATSSSPVAEPADTSGALTVSSQAAGMSVLVDAVTVPPPGVWVAVRDVNPDGSLGNVLGAARAHGPVSGFEVPLLRSTEPGTRYAVMLYRENGDGVFDPQNDSVYVDFDSGVRVVQYFTTNP